MKTGPSTKNDCEIEREIGKLREELNCLKTSKTYKPEANDDQTYTAVFGGLSKAGDIEEAQKWMRDKLWAEWLPAPENMYSKGEFKGILFAKFRTSSERDSIVVWFRTSSTQMSGSNVWSKPDKPLHERIIWSLLYGTKYICDKALWVDEEKGTVPLNKKEVLRGCIRDGLLEIEYGEGWAEYLHDKDYPEFKNMVATLREKLVKGEGGKGGGKEGGKFKGKFKAKFSEK